MGDVSVYIEAARNRISDFEHRISDSTVSTDDYIAKCTSEIKDMFAMWKDLPEGYTLRTINDLMFRNAAVGPDDMFALNNQLMLNYKKHLDIWNTNGKIDADTYEELKHTVQLTSMNFHIGYSIAKMECKQESINQMNLSVPPSMDDFNIWGEDRQKSIHKLIQFLLETAFQLNYRKRGKDLFEPIIYQKHFTYTFKKACTISEFILGHCQSYRASHEWLTDKSTTYRQVETYLEKCKEEMLPDLITNRHIFSFRNGIFNGYANKFVTYEQIESKIDFQTIPHLGVAPPIPLKPVTVCLSSYFGEDGFSSKFVDKDFDDTHYDDPRDMKIAADKILQDQNFDPEVSMWLLGSIGRMIFDVNTYDNFSYAFILNGVGGTGKSQLLNQVLNFYEETFNGRILSSARAAFSLEHLYQSLVTVCGEVDKHFTLPVTTFCQIVGGEPVSVDRRYQVSTPVVWKSQLCFASNTGLPYSTSGSDRRILTFRFKNVVSNQESGLEARLREDYPNFLKKCVGCYFLILKRNPARIGIWSPGILPDILWENRRYMMEQNNSLQAFISDPEIVELSPRYHMLFAEFKRGYQTFCSEKKIEQMRLNEDSYTVIFNMSAIQKFNPKRNLDHPQKQYNHEYLVGIRLV